MVIHSVLALGMSLLFPITEAFDGETLESLSGLDAQGRSAALLSAEQGYVHQGTRSGVLQNPGFAPKPGELVLIRVYRPLSPADLIILDRAGFWPTGYSPDESSFVASVQGDPDFRLLASGGFAERISPYEPSVLPGSSWLVRMAPGFEPPGGSHLFDQWFDIGRLNPRDVPGVLEAWPTETVPGFNHALNTEADDSREVLSLPGIWLYYTGAGVLAGVLDTGVWSDHPDLQGAVVSGPEDTDGHGTAVCGVIASRGGIDLGCLFNGSGVAPGASLMVTERPQEMTASQFASFLDGFYNAGCRVVNNSWGLSTFSYDAFCAVTDEFVGSTGSSVVFSAGNNGAPGTVTSPGASKNSVTVGAVTFIPDAAGNVVPAPYSSGGPTPEGRLKPELLAPGGEFTATGMELGVATTNAFYAGQWLDDPVNRWPGEPDYTRVAGTSMAAAHVTGALTLCYQKYGTLFRPEDASVLLAASAIPLKANTGSPLSGYATTTCGYGLLDGYHLPGTYFSEEVERMLWVHTTIQEGQGPGSWIVYVPANIKMLSVAMAYSDAGGSGLAVDLDLRLTSPSSVQYEFQLPQGVTTESPLERMVIENPQPGAWIVSVVPESWADPGNPIETEEVSVAVYSYSRLPELTVTFPSDTTIYASPGGAVTIPVTVTNTGGFISAGTWARIQAPSGFSGDVGDPAFFGNLVYLNSSATNDFVLQCPDQPGSHPMQVIAGGANRGLENAVGNFTLVLAYPDLEVSIPSPDTPPPFSVGQVTGFTTVVSNVGDGPSPASSMVYHLTENPDSTGRLVATFEVPPLQSGESAVLKGSHSFDYFDMGTRWLVSTVDPDGTIIEANETNNSSSYGPFLVTGELAPPTELAAQSGNDGFVPLSWNPPGDGGSRGLSAYLIYRSLSPVGPDPDPIAELPPSELSMIDSLVVNNLTYYYWATCLYRNPDGESPYSNMAVATPEGPSGSLGGTVSDVYTGRKLPGVSVSLEGLGVVSITDDAGYYIFPGVPVGVATITVEHPGYAVFEDSAGVEENLFTPLDIGLVRLFGQGMTVIPTPFTPNADGINDAASFVWPGAGGESFVLIIFDLGGVPVRTITGAEPVWDGNDDSAAPVFPGVYLFHARTGSGDEVTGTVCVAR